MNKIVLSRTKYSCKCKDPETYSTCEPYKITLHPGKYMIECFGASSAKSKNFPGYGAHTSGILKLTETTVLFAYVGGEGYPSNYDDRNGAYGGYNGGGKGGAGAYYSDGRTYTSSGNGGGGATDIRTVPGSWNDTESLESRIMVAGGGGGRNPLGETDSSKGGSAGKLVGESGYDSSMRECKGGSQNSGYKLGEGESGASKSIYVGRGAEGNSGAGGGYYGGTASQIEGVNSTASGSGGSSYINGYEGLALIDNLHKFTHVHMESGEEVKHLGDGLVIITKISDYTSKCNSYTTVFLFISILTLGS